jgi:sulfatase maturation enzyme AslB (radical SAM superfamily)
MDWDIARAGVEALLRWGGTDRELSISGGEPLLAKDLIRRIVAFVGARGPRDGSITYTLTTNGTLLDNDTLAFLVDQNFNLQISFDGVRAAQDHRRRGSFDSLDRLLDRIQTAHPEFWADRVAVGITLAVSTIPFLARSIEYFVRKGVEHIVVHPAVTWQMWDSTSERELETQVDEILEVSERHWRRTRRLPVGFLHPTEPLDRSFSKPPIACGACAGTGLTVDVEGRAWGCQLLASSIQHLSPLGRSVADALDLGDIRDPAIDRKLAELPRRALNQPLLWALDRKTASYGRCCECRHLATCHICPASTVHIWDNADALRIADFSCAFNRITLDAAALFTRRTSIDRLFDLMDALEEPMRRLAEVLPPGADVRGEG